MNGKKRLLGFGLALILGGIASSRSASKRAGKSARQHKTKSENEDGAGISGTGAADERYGQSKNRSDDFRGRESDEHESDRRQPAAGGRRAGRAEEMAI